MKRRTLLTASLVGVVPILGCTSEPLSPTFEFSWDEQVQLLEGRVIVVKIVRSYQRMNLSRGAYDEPILSRGSEVTFDSESTYGVVTQKFLGFRPMFLDRLNGSWYLGLIGGSQGKSELIDGQNWGKFRKHGENNMAKLIEGKWTPIPMAEFPDTFKLPNVLVLYGTAKEHSKFDKKLVTLEMKNRWLEEYPLSPPDHRIERSSN
jgi:hypothetical protein